ncbi:hypothetical protein [Gimesia fumaroli]|uniref:Uncharacterized protein n=1 Tax=Gimesia fumaroli TaxID=2527976 RepID=A0A518IKW6_9PLAN|nr:hypothetical protein [Gimesia fumaroli]QDV53729.1 hypothetical protein Enr17x_58100 [Gimesia fumaroli]
MSILKTLWNWLFGFKTENVLCLDSVAVMEPSKAAEYPDAETISIDIGTGSIWLDLNPGDMVEFLQEQER